MPTPAKKTAPQTPAAQKNRKRTSGDSGNSAVARKPNGRQRPAIDSGISRVDAPSNVETVDLSLDVIIVDGDLQMRAGGTDEELVEEYRAELLRGTRFPPVGVTLGDDGAYYLYSGFTRTEAAKRAGKKSIQATVRPGGKREALLFAVGENNSHGKRRTRADVQRAIEVLLLDPEWGIWSDGQIAEKVDTDPKTVGAARRRLTEDGRLQPADVRRGRDGRTYQAPRKPASKHATNGKNGAVADAGKPVQVPTAVHATDHVSEMFGATEVAVTDAEHTVTESESSEPETTVTKPTSPETPMSAPTSDPPSNMGGAKQMTTASTPHPVIASANDARAMIRSLADQWALYAWVDEGDDDLVNLQGLESMLKDRFRDWASESPDAASAWLDSHHERLADLLPRGDDSDGVEV